MIERYFDNASTTPLDPRVRDEMLPYLGEFYGNSNSLHEPGRRARAAVETARARVAELLGAEDPQQIIFTSGATEANNWVLRAHPNGVMSPFEHASVRETGLALGYLELESDDVELGQAQEGDLLSVMTVNNELGTRWDPAEHRGGARRLHSDLTQAVGKIPVDLEPLDYASFSAHKFYGPMGVGALYYREDPPLPFLTGGEQELGVRAGTVNVAAIVGMGAAAAIAGGQMDADLQRAITLRAILLDELRDEADMMVNGGPAVSPYIVSLSFLNLAGETLVVEMDRAGFAISSGAACSTGSNELSHVLQSLAMEPEWARGTIRVSFGRYNTFEACQNMARNLLQITRSLRTMK